MSWGQSPGRVLNRQAGQLVARSVASNSVLVADLDLLTNSVPGRHESRKVSLKDEGMRYLAASIGLLTTLVLIAPFH